MIDINKLRENSDLVKKGVSDKQMDASIVDSVLELDKQRRDLISTIDKLRADRNKAAKEQNHEEGKRIKEELKKLEPSLAEVEEKYNEAINKIPNLALEDVPVGKGEDENRVIREWSPTSPKASKGKDHLELAMALNLIDFEAGAKVAGSQFYYLKNDLVKLEFALMQFGMEILQERGYKLFLTPDLAKSRYYLGTGYAPRGEEAQIYEIKEQDLGLIATAEVTMAGYHADEVLNKKDLPLKYAAFSHCFRQEAGAYGKYSKGLYRVHQFSKLEVFIYCEPSKSHEMHEEILGIEEEIMQKLKLPYRVVEMCTGDLGAIAAKKYDIDAWMPGRGDYGEVTSTSNTTDYQARNLNIKYREGDHNEYVHMLNGTAVVGSRFPIAILENYQNEDGSITIPEVLRKWMGKDKIG
jgi:seryl-tRNA synthetase